MPTAAVRVIISGRVQGVGYRSWTVSKASALNLKGWVRNVRDGTVEAVFSGEKQSIAVMLEACKKGPLLARVTNVQQFDCNEPAEESFISKPTT